MSTSTDDEVEGARKLVRMRTTQRGAELTIPFQRRSELEPSKLVVEWSTFSRISILSVFLE